ncbi:MAG: hypothetical protein ACRC62_20895 [Microcoleus sp.]
MQKNCEWFHLSPEKSNRIHLLSALQLALPARIAFAPYNQNNKPIEYRRSSSARCGVKLVRETSDRGITSQAKTSTNTSNKPSKTTWNPSNFLRDVKSILAVKSVMSPFSQKQEMGAKIATVKLKASTISGS